MAIGRLTFLLAIKGLRPTEDIFFREITGSSRAYLSEGRGPSEPEDQGGVAREELASPAGAGFCPA
jgi:hypothetical protein